MNSYIYEVLTAVPGTVVGSVLVLAILMITKFQIRAWCLYSCCRKRAVSAHFSSVRGHSGDQRKSLCSLSGRPQS